MNKIDDINLLLTCENWYLDRRVNSKLIKENMPVIGVSHSFYAYNPTKAGHMLIEILDFPERRRNSRDKILV